MKASEASVKLAEQTCLEQIQDLNAAVADSILAISEDAVERLEECLWRQQVLCSSIQTSVASLRSQEVSRSTLERLISAFTTLRSTNLTYTDLIEQARFSTELLYKLCLDYGQRLQSPAESPSARLSLEA